MSGLSNTFEASSLKTNEKQYLKNSLDREYKLLTANQSVFSHSKNVERETLDGSRDQFWKEASIRSERKPSNKEISAPAEGFTVDNNYYKHEIQNLRSSLNEMRDKALKTKMMTSELRTTNTRQLEQVSDLEKEKVKKLQAEREEDVAESLSYREGLRSPLERNHIDSAGKKKVKMAYEQKEKEIYERVLGSSAKKQKEDYLHSNWNSAGSYKDELQGRSPNGLPREDENSENEQKEIREFSASKDQGYFTNKELVRAKYEQYEKDLLKKKEKGQHKRKAEDGQQEDSSLENSVEKKFDRSEVSGKKQSSLYPVPEETENDRAHEKSVSYKREYNSRENHDEFGKALEKRERKLQEEYDNIEKEKSWRNRGLVYREYDQPEADDEERLEPKVQYATKQFPNSDFLALELEKLKDENQRIKREIKDIQKRNDVERRHYSAKLTQEDFRMSHNPQNHSGSKKLNKLKNQRKAEDEWAFSEVVKGEDIRKTIDRARKSVHKKMEGAKQERSWKEARNKSTANITEDVFIGYKTRSRSPQFHAGIPSNHLRESAFLLARGIPTRYVSNRGLNSLSQSVRSATSRSLRK